MQETPVIIGFEPLRASDEALDAIRRRAVKDRDRAMRGWTNQTDADRRTLLHHVAALDLQLRSMQLLYQHAAELFDELPKAKQEHRGGA